jgi:hypothetical protein
MKSVEQLYEALKSIGAKIDNHESDLYVLQTPETLALVQDSGSKYSTFVSQLDGEVWIDVPFAFLPWWRARTG